MNPTPRETLRLIRRMCDAIEACLEITDGRPVAKKMLLAGALDQLVEMAEALKKMVLP